MPKHPLPLYHHLKQGAKKTVVRRPLRGSSDAPRNVNKNGEWDFGNNENVDEVEPPEFNVVDTAAYDEYEPDKSAAEESGYSSYEDVLEIEGQDAPDCLPRNQTAITLDLVVPLEQEFLERGWRKYHTSFLGGKRSEDDANTILRSLVKLLLRIYYTALMQQYQFVAFMTAYDFLVKLVKQKALHQALNNVIEAYPFQNETLKVHLLHLMYTLRWLPTQTGTYESLISA